MFKRIWSSGFWVCVFAAMTGCGGAGTSTSEDDVDGAFTMEMIPDADGQAGRDFAIEIDATGGKIVDGVARFVFEDYTHEFTTNIVGSAFDGSIEASADFGKFEIEIVAQFTGSSWKGSYTIFSGASIVEQGELNIDRTGDATRNVTGFWNGNLVFFKGSVPVSIEIDQKGNSLSATGTMGALNASGAGYIVGNSVALMFETTGTPSTVDFLATLDGAGNTLTGSGLAEENFNITLEKK